MRTVYDTPASRDTLKWCNLPADGDKSHCVTMDTL